MKPKNIFPLLILLICWPLVLTAQEHRSLAVNDVIWTSPGTNENNSMPLGNGDLALNVWTEQNGDIVLLLAKSDAWSENGQLLKLGRVRVKLTPNPFVSSAAFTQTLSLADGTVQIQAGKNSARIWADANHPVIHVEVNAEFPVQLEAKSEVWRSKPYHLDPGAVSKAGFFEWGNNPGGLDFDADTILPAKNNQVSWCHFNSRSIYPLVFEREHLGSLLEKYPDPLLHRCFGVGMRGPGLVMLDGRTLKSSGSSKSCRLDCYALTEPADSPESWQLALNTEIASLEAIKIESAWRAHQQWWAEFWNRSWLRVGGTADAAKVSQSYALQRYLTACAGRGAQPIKFNGSLFTVGHDLEAGTSSSESNHDPDYRAWGNSFWNQNTRLIYWPLIATGDFDLLSPWFDLYVQALPLARDRTRFYFHHDGGAFIETIYFWGLPNVNDFGWDNPGPELQSEWMRYHIQGGLEVLAQMLDRYDYTQEADFAKDTLLPMADATITFYDQHWQRGADGKILMAPSQALETYQRDAVNPTPDVAGLMSTLPRLLSLPSGLTTVAQRNLWAKVLKDLPPLPIGTTANGRLPPQGRGDLDGKRVILPAQKYGEPKNHENPELYSVFPFPLYGVGKSNLALARDTFHARINPFGKCWGQDGIHAALLGLTDEAKKSVIEEFTSYGSQQFPWFWSKNSDWIPDMDNGGAGMMTLQLMLMQCDGKRIQLLPAWPADWTADFKLHAPYQTTVEGHVEHGTVTRLKVTPADRVGDVSVAAALVGEMVPTNAPDTTSPYKNQNLAVSARVADLIARMTVEEKARQLDMYFGCEAVLATNQYTGRTHAKPDAVFNPELAKKNLGTLGVGSIHDIYPRARLSNRIQDWVMKSNRLGIPTLFIEEGLHGYMDNDEIVFPQSINLAATWNPALARQTGAAIAAQARANGVDMILGPVLDVARDPRWGRVEEDFGEDPYLTGRFGLAYVQGMQGDSLNTDHTVIAEPKHFVGHGSPEGGLNMSPVHAGEREIRSIMLKSFEPAVREGKAMGIMAAYHDIDGVPCTGNPWLLNKVLRGEWDFQGFVLSDLGAIRRLYDTHHVADSATNAVLLALNSGVDMQFYDFDHETFQNAIINGVKNGQVSAATVNQAVARILRVKFQLGLFDHPFVDENLDARVRNSPSQAELALETARQSMCLLKNENNLLPLSKGLRRVAIIGPNANVARLGDYSEGAQETSASGMFEQIKQLVSTNTEALFCDGENIQNAVDLAKSAELVILGLGEWQKISGEGFDRSDLNLPGRQEELLEAVVATGKPVVLVLQNGRPLSIAWAASHVPAILEAWYPGEFGGRAIAETLFGDNNPAGRLPITFPRSVGQLPVYYNHFPSKKDSYLEGDSSPLFVFGHGLSYTTFKYDNLDVRAPSVQSADDVLVACKITNAGQREGDEVAQLYVRQQTASVAAPVKALKGFCRVHLPPGESRVITFHLKQADLAVWNANQEWRVEPGQYTVTVGGDSSGGLSAIFTLD